MCFYCACVEASVDATGSTFAIDKTWALVTCALFGGGLLNISIATDGTSMVLGVLGGFQRRRSGWICKPGEGFSCKKDGYSSDYAV